MRWWEIIFAMMSDVSLWGVSCNDLFGEFSRIGQRKTSKTTCPAKLQKEPFWNIISRIAQPSEKTFRIERRQLFGFRISTSKNLKKSEEPLLQNCFENPPCHLPLERIGLVSQPQSCKTYNRVKTWRRVSKAPSFQHFSALGPWLAEDQSILLL